MGKMGKIEGPMINKQNTTRFAPGGVGGASRATESSPPVRKTDTGTDTGKEIPAIWAGVRETLRRRLGEARFDAWIGRLDLIAEVNGEILVAAQGELEYDRVNREFIRDIQHAWNQADALGRKVRLDVRTRIEPEVLALAQPAAKLPAMQAEVAGELEVDPVADEAMSETVEEVQTLDNFLVGDSNRIAFGLARRLALGASVAAHVVTVIGPHGVGKTHLLRGIEAALKATKGEGSVLYMSSEDFTVAFVEGVKRKDTSDLRSMVRRAKVVLLDDFQFICSKPGTLVEFFSHLRAIVANGGVVVLACDQTPAVLDQLDDRMRDEIQGGVTVHMDLPERSLRREILRTKADAITSAYEEFVFPDEWVELLADRLPASGRALSGAVKNVFVGTVMVNEPLSRAAVEKAIQLQLGGSPVRAPKIDTIKDVTAKAYGVTKQDLESACRKRQFAQPRQYAMYLSRQLTKCSYPQIGRLFGDRDHTTVLFAYRKISAMVGSNEAMAEELRQLEQRILADPRNNR
jgi:chromosomal replication initiator protein